MHFSLLIYFTDKPVRLQGPVSENGTGRVEIFHRGLWGRICGNGWDMNEARVVCRELGYRYAVRALKGGEVPVGIGKIWLNNLECIGTEKNLSSCSHNGWRNHRCKRNQDAGVECSATGNIGGLVPPHVSGTVDMWIGRWVGGWVSDTG